MGSTHSMIIGGHDPLGTKTKCQDWVETTNVVAYPDSGRVEVATIMVACDGVGSCPHSEVGAFIVAKIVLAAMDGAICNAFDEQQDKHNPIDVDVLDGAVAAGLQEGLEGIVALGKMTQRVRSWLPTTAVVMVVNDVYARAFIAGDGAVGVLTGPEAKVKVQQHLTARVLGDKDCMIEHAPGAVAQEPNNGNRVHVDASTAWRHTTSSFWAPALRVDGPVLHAFVSTDGLRHHRQLRLLAQSPFKVSGEDITSSHRAACKTATTSTDYVDDLGMVWWLR